MTEHYFAKNGHHGRAEALVVLDTADWGADHWDYIERLPDTERHLVAERILLGYGSLDQQDCPSIFDSGRHCRFTGVVYRHFEYPAQKESGGYTWTCPECDTDHEYEGDL